MKTVTVYDHYLSRESVRGRETNDQPSLAIPGMSVPLRELLDRYVKGREIPVRSDEVFEGHLNIPDLRSMNKIDREMYAKQVRATVADYQKRLADAHEAKKVDHVKLLQSKISELESKLKTEKPLISE